MGVPISGSRWVVTGASSGIGEAIASDARSRPRGERQLDGVELQLMPEVPREWVASAVVGAVEHGRAAVRLPRRAAAFPMITSAPQRIVDLLTTGTR